MAVPQRIEDFLISLSDDELRSLAAELSHALGLQTAVPLTKLELILTEDCTFRCDYCFVEGKNSHRKMDWPMAKAGIDYLISNSRDAEKLEITLFGGEPLMEFGLIRRIVSYAEERQSETGKRIAWALTTNGMLIDEEKMEFFAAHGVSVLLSIDGNRESQDAHRRLADGSPTFDLVFPKIALMKSYQPWLGARMTVNPDTVYTLAADVRFLHESGINQFIVGANQDAAWTRWSLDAHAEQWRAVAEYYMEQKKANRWIRMAAFESSPEELRSKSAGVWGCEAGRDKIALTPTGDLHACSKFASQNNGKGRCRIGAIEKGITEIRFRAELQDNRISIRGRCLGCDIADYCMGGCPADNLEKTGSIYVPTETDCWFNRTYLNTLMSIPGLTEVHRLGEAADSSNSAG